LDEFRLLLLPTLFLFDILAGGERWADSADTDACVIDVDNSPELFGFWLLNGDSDSTIGRGRLRERLTTLDLGVWDSVSDKSTVASGVLYPFTVGVAIGLIFWMDMGSEVNTTRLIGSSNASDRNLDSGMRGEGPLPRGDKFGSKFLYSLVSIFGLELEDDAERTDAPNLREIILASADSLLPANAGDCSSGFCGDLSTSSSLRLRNAFSKSNQNDRKTATKSTKFPFGGKIGAEGCRTEVEEEVGIRWRLSARSRDERIPIVDTDTRGGEWSDPVLAIGAGGGALGGGEDRVPVLVLGDWFSVHILGERFPSFPGDAVGLTPGEMNCGGGWWNAVGWVRFHDEDFDDLGVFGALKVPGKKNLSENLDE
jgi:hypothetical protein